VVRLTSATDLVYLCHAVSVSKALSKRKHVLLPVDVVADIDKLVGKPGRSAFITEVARDEIQRLQQRNALLAAKGTWKDEDHPELKDEALGWVRQMRSESEKRFEDIEQHRDRPDGGLPAE
jgi:Arc/MetJ-type ribon-helix-helix transcriptional regulator